VLPNIVDLDDCVNFLARIPVRLEANVRLQQLNLKGKFRLAGRLLRRGRFFLARFLCWSAVFCPTSWPNVGPSKANKVVSSKKNKIDRLCVSR